MNETVMVKRDTKEQMKNTENIKSLVELTEKRIDIFDLFYEVMKCYKNIFNKDIYKNNKSIYHYNNINFIETFLDIYILLYI